MVPAPVPPIRPGWFSGYGAMPCTPVGVGLDPAAGEIRNRLGWLIPNGRSYQSGTNPCDTAVGNSIRQISVLFLNCQKRIA